MGSLIGKRSLFLDESHISFSNIRILNLFFLFGSVFNWMFHIFNIVSILIQRMDQNTSKKKIILVEKLMLCTILKC